LNTTCGVEVFGGLLSRLLSTSLLHLIGAGWLAGSGNVGNNVGNDIINDIIGPTLSMMK
jgi:hypothetical protein